MADKKDGGKMYQPKQQYIRAVQWNGQSHPLVKDQCNCGKGCELCEAKVPVLVHRGGRAPIARGDYIIGPDSQNLVHVFNQKEFEAQFELASAPTEVKIHGNQAKWLQSTFAINCMNALLAWLRQNVDSQWAASNPGARQEMYEHAKFLEKHVEAMERSRRGE